MKATKMIRLCLFSFYLASLLVFGPLAAISQQITGVEYFIDQDPGCGLATSIPVAPDSNLSNIAFTLPVETLPGGFHSLFIRSKDEYHVWSLSARKSFFLEPANPVITPALVRLEYFIDTDPGFGLATEIALSNASNVSNVIFPLDIESLTPGFHQLFIRSKDAGGKWSLTGMRSFFRENPANLAAFPIAAVEYFIDIDPGFGMGIQIPVTPSLTIEQLVFPLDTDLLTPGFHQLFIRSRNVAGKWSLTSRRNFFLETPGQQPLPGIARIEYFIDNDPGPGLGTPLNFPQGTNQASLLFPLPVSELEPGFHQLFIRSQDSLGKWSLTARRPFYKWVVNTPAPEIVKAEYFVDSDPGHGLGINVPVNPSVHITNLQFIADLIGLTYGQHQVFFRTCDNQGKWSLTNSNTLTYSGFLITSMGPLHVCPGQPVILKAPSSPGKNYQWHLNNQPVQGAADPVLYAYDPGSYYVRIYAPGFLSDTSNSLTVTHQASPLMPVLSGPDTVCQYQTGTTYSTQQGMSSYAWNIPAGGTIVSGGTINDYETTIRWTQSGVHDITVNYIGTNGCPSLQPGSLDVTVNAPPATAGPVSGPSVVTRGQQGVTYSVAPVPLASGYSWSVPAGVTVVSGLNTPSIVVNFATNYMSGNFSVMAENDCGMGAASPLFAVTGVAPIPATLTLQNLSFGSGSVQCYNATQTLLVGGQGHFFLVQADALVTLISGNRIILKEGTTVEPGGYLHGFITPSGQYCSSMKAGIPANPAFSDEDLMPVDEVVTSIDFTCYPNPTSGKFSLRLNKDPLLSSVDVMIFNPMGTMLFHKLICEGTLHGLTLENYPSGIYYIRIIQAGSSVTIKMIRL